ncbi:hypothetical protein [Limosilactobacillus reuteri]|nr:hypothetical protein [Limosilactobacillus reuteri]
MKNRNVELVVESEEYIEPFDETKIYFVLNSCGKNITDKYDFWIDGQKRIHAKSKIEKNIDEGARLICEEYEREGKQIGSIAVLEPSYDQWGRMGKITGQTYIGEKMFDRFTTAPQGVQIGILISEMLKKRN